MGILHRNVSPSPNAGRLLALSLLSIVALAGCGPRLNIQPGQVVDLSGQWQLSAALSDDPRVLLEKLRPAVDRRRGNGPPGGPPLGTTPVRRRPGDPASIDDYVVQPARLSIEQGAKELRLVADGSPTRFIYGERFGTSSMRGVSERRSGWEGSSFVTYEEVREGPDVTCTYQLSGNQLIVITDVNGGGIPDLDFRSVYERIPASAAGR